eukprot:gene12324-16529_t
MIDQELNILQGVQVITGSLSIIACLLMFHRLRKEGFTINQSNPNEIMTNGMLKILFSIDFVLAIFYGIGVSGTKNQSFCQLQGFVVQGFGLFAILWNLLMSIQFYLWIVKKRHPKRLVKGFKRWTIAIILFTSLIAIIFAGLGIYNNSALWCWIGSKYPILRLVFFDIILIGTWIATIFLFREISTSLKIRSRGSSKLDSKINELLDSNEDNLLIQRKLMLFTAAFAISWFFAVLNRLVEISSGKLYFSLSLLEVIFLPLQGFFNAIAYGGYLDKLLFKQMKKSILSTSIKHRFITGHHSVQVKRTSDASRSNRLKISGYVPKTYSIFTTTFNMGEAPPSAVAHKLADWIVLGHDVYAIGMQECLDIAGMRSLILSHLSQHEKYEMYATEIGSGNTSLGFHGFIALTLFVKTNEVRLGHIYPSAPSAEMTATGADLIITTAQNKGAVGLPLQIHDTSVGFVTAHLPSDSKGKSKLTKRNASAHSILREVILAPEDLGFDLHYQHDHVFVFGDLNYRMEAGSSGIGTITGVAVASLIEKNAMNDDYEWVHRKYNLLRAKSDQLYPNLEELRILKNAKLAAKGAWSSVLRGDELRSIMDDGDAFCGFDEPVPTFPPSYKRKKGDEEADCGDYTDPAIIIQGYSHTGEVDTDSTLKRSAGRKSSKARTMTITSLTQTKDDLESHSNHSNDSNQNENVKRKETPPAEPVVVDAKKIRPPSYTDRILIHSLSDRKDRLTVQAYDICDVVRCSDHRPVSMAILMEVNSNILFQTPPFNNAIQSAIDSFNNNNSSNKNNKNDTENLTKEPSFELYELVLSDLSINFESILDLKDAEDDDDDDIDSISDNESQKESKENNDISALNLSDNNSSNYNINNNSNESNNIKNNNDEEDIENDEMLDTFDGNTNGVGVVSSPIHTQRKTASSSSSTSTTQENKNGNSSTSSSLTSNSLLQYGFKKSSRNSTTTSNASPSQEDNINTPNKRKGSIFSVSSLKRLSIWSSNTANDNNSNNNPKLDDNVVEMMSRESFDWDSRDA